MRKLIVNADDFGITVGAVDGILQCMKEGVVSSTTSMANGEFIEYGIETIKRENLKNIGIHLVLTTGRAILKNHLTLTDKDGFFIFKGYNSIRNLRIDEELLKEIEDEFKAQIEFFYNKGVSLTHIDSHHHVHEINGIREIVIKLAKEFNLKVRSTNEELKEIFVKENIKTTDLFSSAFYKDNATLDNFKRLISDFNNGSLEIMCHPAYLDDGLKKVSSYYKHRDMEKNILCSKALKDWLFGEGISLVNYADI